jgi:anti-sigma B factor antagonist
MADLDPAAQAAAPLDVRDESGTPVIWLSGELDNTNAGQVRAAIEAALGSHPDRVVLDASGVTFMDSSGIALLASMTHRARQVQVRNPTAIIRRLIELTGLDQVLQITS